MVTSSLQAAAPYRAFRASAVLAESAAVEDPAGPRRVDFSRPVTIRCCNPIPGWERDMPDRSAHFFLNPLPVVGEGWGEGAFSRFPCAL